jgi:hypothetical protein
VVKIYSQFIYGREKEEALNRRLNYLNRHQAKLKASLWKAEPKPEAVNESEARAGERERSEAAKLFSRLNSVKRLGFF